MEKNTEAQKDRIGSASPAVGAQASPPSGCYSPKQPTSLRDPGFWPDCATLWPGLCTAPFGWNRRQFNVFFI